MTTTDTELAALIGSRICHDLISPIGAINNGFELLSMSRTTEGPEMELISESVGNASARIRFFRIAFGAAGDQMVGAPEITSILRDLYEKSRLDVVWNPEDPKPRAGVRLAFLALLCIETAMPYGGRVQVNEENGSWQLTGTADKFNPLPELWAALNCTKMLTGLQPSHVQFALLPTNAADDQRVVSATASETSVEIRF